MGDFVNGTREGKGTLTEPGGGRVYTGEFRNDDFNGTGELRYSGSGGAEGEEADSSGGDVYTGQFRDGMCHGEGRLQMADGSEKVGTWKDGAMVGAGRTSGLQIDSFNAGWKKPVTESCTSPLKASQTLRGTAGLRR